MGYRMPARPDFLVRALQGLAFWMGHRHAYFRSYPLSESALVTEACNLINANLKRGQILRPEVLYRRLANVSETDLSELARADLTILDAKAPDPYTNDVSEAVQFVIEVKRGSAADSLIDEDLRRLYRFLQVGRPGVRAFLIVASESKLPDRFVDPDKGVSRLHPHVIPNTDGVYHVRRTVKAATSFEKKENAHFICLCEVFASRPAKIEELPKI